MLTEQQLRWVQENRNRTRSAQDRPAREAGEVAAKILATPTFRGLETRDKIGEVLETVLGNTLAKHCSVGEQRRGVLVVYVDDPTVCFALHSEYRETVQTALAQASLERAIRAVQFVQDRSIKK